MEINSQLNTFPNTFYLSYAGKVTKKKKGGNSIVPSCVPSYNFLLLLQVFQICSWRYPLNVPPPYNGYRYVCNFAIILFYMLNEEFYFATFEMSKLLILVPNAKFLTIRMVQRRGLVGQWWRTQHNIYDSPSYSKWTSSLFPFEWFWVT